MTAPRHGEGGTRLGLPRGENIVSTLVLDLAAGPSGERRVDSTSAAHARHKAQRSAVQEQVPARTLATEWLPMRGSYGWSKNSARRTLSSRRWSPRSPK